MSTGFTRGVRCAGVSLTVQERGEFTEVRYALGSQRRALNGREALAELTLPHFGTRALQAGTLYYVFRSDSKLRGEFILQSSGSQWKPWDVELRKQSAPWKTLHLDVIL